MVAFNKEYVYKNTGTIVGTINYVGELTRNADGSVYGHKFLMSVKGHGSVEVRVPMVSKSTPLAEAFSGKRTHVRINLAQLDMWKSKAGKLGTNFLTFTEFKETEAQDEVKGLLAGEVMDFKEVSGAIKVKLVIFPTDSKTGKLRTRMDGTPLDAKQVIVNIEDEALKAQFNEEVQIGTNLGIKYTYTNKTEKVDDGWGMGTNESVRVSKASAYELKVFAGKKEPKPEPTPSFDTDVFGGDDFFLTEEDIPF